MPLTHDPTAALSRYLPSTSVEDYLAYMREISPKYADTLWLDRQDAQDIIDTMNQSSVDFEDDSNGGRANSYQESQLNPTVRFKGIAQMLQLLTKKETLTDVDQDFKILDVLGGDGTLERAVRESTEDSVQDLFLTSDISASMIDKAIHTYSLPAVRQPAQDLFIKDNSFDGVIIAYGSHHIPTGDRRQACREAYRVLKPDGIFVLHDFEVGSSHARWFGEVVDQYSATGHKYHHFTVSEMLDYMTDCGFASPRVFSMYDPFVVSDSTEEGAVNKLLDYVMNMYGLVKLKENGIITPESRRKVMELIREHVHYDLASYPESDDTWKSEFSVRKEGSSYVAELPRVALVGVAEKA